MISQNVEHEAWQSLRYRKHQTRRRGTAIRIARVTQRRIDKAGPRIDRALTRAIALTTRARAAVRCATAARIVAASTYVVVRTRIAVVTARTRWLASHRALRG